MMVVAHKCWGCVDLNDAVQKVPNGTVGISHYFAPWQGVLDPNEDAG